MSEQTSIAWTDSTFNIAWGCVKVSPGCQHCYAELLAKRYGHDVWGSAKDRRTMSAGYWDAPRSWDRKAREAGVSHRVFTSSMCDVFAKITRLSHSKGNGSGI